MRKIKLLLDVSRTVELYDFCVSGSASLRMKIAFVELGVTIEHDFSFESFFDWRKDPVNAGKTVLDYMKPVLVDLYEFWATMQQVQKYLDGQAVES